jgi:hypothetical protein
MPGGYRTAVWGFAHLLGEGGGKTDAGKTSRDSTMRTALHYAASAALHLVVGAFGPALVGLLIWMGAR